MPAFLVLTLRGRAQAEREVGISEGEGPYGHISLERSMKKEEGGWGVYLALGPAWLARVIGLLLFKKRHW